MSPARSTAWCGTFRTIIDAPSTDIDDDAADNDVHSVGTPPSLVHPLLCSSQPWPTAMPIYRSTRLSARWAARGAMLLIGCAVVFATYVVIPHLCVSYLMQTRHQHAAAITLIVLYSVFLLLASLCYLRTVLAAKLDPGVVCLRGMDDDARVRVEDGPDMDPDSPGLEVFYSHEVFMCEPGGRPRWCSSCANWKPDRANHSRDLGRCVRKMDHFCPWVGGMVSETSFNFFTQFNGYCTLYYAICFVTSVYCLVLQKSNDEPIDVIVLVLIVISSFFGLFAGGMFVTTIRYILMNITNIDMLRHNKHVYILAVAVPRGATSPDGRFTTVTYPLPLDPTFHSLPPASDSLADQLDDLAASLDRAKMASRDRLATRTFAILRTEPGENPWDLGWRANWQSVMGHSIWEYLLPLRKSPCTRNTDMRSMYATGPLIDILKHRYGIDELETRLI